MAKAVEVFKKTMIGARRLADEQAAADKAREQRARPRGGARRRFRAGDRQAHRGGLTSAAREMEATAGAMLSTADQTDQRSSNSGGRRRTDFGQRADRRGGGRGVGGFGAGDQRPGRAIGEDRRQGGRGRAADRRTGADIDVRRTRSARW